MFLYWNMKLYNHWEFPAKMIIVEALFEAKVQANKTYCDTNTVKSV